MKMEIHAYPGKSIIYHLEAEDEEVSVILKGLYKVSYEGDKYERHIAAKLLDKLGGDA